MGKIHITKVIVGSGSTLLTSGGKGSSSYLDTHCIRTPLPGVGPSVGEEEGEPEPFRPVDQGVLRIFL